MKKGEHNQEIPQWQNIIEDNPMKKNNPSPQQKQQIASKKIKQNNMECWTANFAFRKFHIVWRIGTKTSLLENVKFAYCQFR